MAERSLSDAYLDPSVGFVGARVLAKKEGRPVREAEAALSGLTVVQRFKRMRRPKAFRRITAPPYSFEIDVVYLPASHRNAKNEQYALTLVDVLSRYAFMYQLKSRNARKILDEYKAFLRDVALLRGIGDGPGPPIQSVRGDNEFAMEAFQRLNQERGIAVSTFVSDHDKAAPGNSLGILDRFVRTIKLKIKKWIDANAPRIDYDLAALLENYNTTPHVALGGLTPRQVFLNEEQQGRVRLKNALHNMRASALQASAMLRIGDRVRYNVRKSSKVAKERPTFSKAVERVVGREGNRFRVSNTNRLYKGVELLRVPPPDVVPSNVSPPKGPAPPDEPPPSAPKSSSPTTQEASKSLTKRTRSPDEEGLRTVRLRETPSADKRVIIADPKEAWLETVPQQLVRQSPPPAPQPVVTSSSSPSIEVEAPKTRKRPEPASQQPPPPRRSRRLARIPSDAEVSQKTLPARRARSVEREEEEPTKLRRLRQPPPAWAEPPVAAHPVEVIGHEPADAGKKKVQRYQVKWNDGRTAYRAPRDMLPFKALVDAYWRGSNS